MADQTITSANSVFMLSIRNLYSSPQQVQGYMADAAFATDEVEPTETVMGVDAFLSGGWVAYSVKQTISIMPNSPSSQIFDDWLAAMKAAREVYVADATIRMPSIGKNFTLTKGYLKGAKVMVDAKKVLQGREFKIEWESVQGANI